MRTLIYIASLLEDGPATRYRKALKKISRLPTGQLASPSQCSAVIIAMDALEG